MCTKKLSYIQLLRAVAAILVVMFHSSVATSKYSDFPARSSELLSLGAYGVDLFFVISGFVIFYANSNFTPGEFLRRRLERIVPIYWLFILIAVPLALHAAGAQFSWTRLLASLGFVSFLHESGSILYVGWTLEFEMLFYLCTALAMLLRRYRWHALCVAIATLVGLGALMPSSTPTVNFLTSPFMLEFLAGILVARWIQTRRVGKVEGLALVIAAAMVTLLKENYRFLWLGIPASLLVWCGAALGDRALPRWLVAMGDASFSIYLLQVFTVAACARLMHAVYPHLDPDLFVLLATLVTVLAGMASYRWLEVPIRDYFRYRRHASGRQLNGGDAA
ncbi:acyltransferase [Herbaspirillum sp. YR522]|uniref:acyltransferase family protein n=1 Tax=Herbaspirillum sp. YR522 TaxID=1144342 RepID=UPI00026F885E|nr:acyltransferase [Herbaspirillum sp. YR522]EJN03271.1 putative acyltransferase [Herbaspirillum sp. YR522]